MKKLKKILRGEFTFLLLVNRATRIFNLKINKNIVQMFCKGRKKSESEETLKNINIKTYDGHNQAVHPDVIIGKYRGEKCYFMVVTPYPFGDDRYENPCVYYSKDSEVWKELNLGRENPIAYPSKGKKNHLSDAEAFYLSGHTPELWVYYRECTFEKTGNYDIIYRKKACSIKKWSDAEMLYKTYAGGAISPSIINYGGLFHIFFIRINSDNKTEMVSVTTDSGDFNGRFETIKISNEPINKIIWHVDVVVGNNCLHAMITYADGTTGVNSKLYYAKSSDGGRTFDIDREVCFSSKKALKSIYRSCLVENIDEKTSFDLYISAQTKKSNWYIYMKKRFLYDEIDRKKF